MYAFFFRGTMKIQTILRTCEVINQPFKIHPFDFCFFLFEARILRNLKQFSQWNGFIWTCMKLDFGSELSKKKKQKNKEKTAQNFALCICTEKLFRITPFTNGWINEIHESPFTSAFIWKKNEKFNTKDIQFSFNFFHFPQICLCLSPDSSL